MNEIMPSDFISMIPRRGYIRAGLILTLWYLSSSVAVILTKSLFEGSAHRLRPFPFGLTVTATNNIMAASAAALLFGPRTFPNQDSSMNQLALIIGATTAAEIGLSNFALILLSVSYATVLKGMAPFFVMAWGTVLGLQRIRWSVVSIMIAIAVGLGLAVTGEDKTKHTSLSNFLQAGFLAQLLSALFSGFRWILTQVFIKGETIGNDYFTSFMNIRPMMRGLSAVDTIRMTAPCTLLLVLPFVLALEGTALARWMFTATLTEMLNLLTILVLIGMCVFMLLWSEYELVKITSSLTVAVGFVLKEVLVIFAGSLIFGDKLSTQTYLGFALVQCAVFCYSLIRTESIMADNILPHS